MARPRAVGAYVFAGGFTLGVREHFDVACHLEEGPYGVSTVRRNMPELPVHVGVGSWPLGELGREPPDLVYGNPPCAAWSPAGALMTRERDWRTDPRVDCTRRHFSLLEELRPRVWAWESVCQAYTTGRDFVDELTGRAVSLGYSVTYLLHNSQYLGCPQRRHRFFFIAHRVELGVPDPPWEWQSCGEVLRKINYVGDQTPAASKIRRYDDLFPHVRQGETLRAAWDRLNPVVSRKANGTIVGRPAFTMKRPRADQPAGVVMNEMVHPTEHRFMTVPELKALCGFPADYEFEDLTDVGQISRGVMPTVGAWLAGIAAHAVERGKEVASPEVRLVDVREPPGRRGPAVREVKKERKMPETYPKPEPGEGSGTFIRKMLRTGQFNPDQIVAAVHANFPNARTTVRDVAWNRAKVRKEDAGEGASVPKKSGETLATITPQPTRSRRENVDHDRRFDTTALHRGGSQERTVHRDYAAHFFRWGFAGRFINGSIEVLDVGCGTDLPLVSILNHPRSNVPRRYVGVDYNPEPKRVPSRQWGTFLWEFDFTTRYRELGEFDLVTCFEVVEHMRPEDGARLLSGIKKCLRPGGTALLSTPVFDGKAAANHLHEWTVPELQAAIEKAGLRVERRHGTFANERAVKKVCTPAERETIDRLKEYYSGDVVACFLAPLYPDASRNCVWVLKRRR